ncbi:MAG TPA: hypothetical protein VIO60_08985 [Rectinemataceae bacterium]
MEKPEKKGAYGYEAAASIMHDRASVEGILGAYRPLLGSIGAFELAEGERGPGPRCFFVLTGGTERIILEKIGAKERSLFPLILVAHPRHNSLAACLEISARLGQEGRKCSLVFLSGPEDRKGAESLASKLELADAMDRMARSRIGAVGKPSDWLVASNQGAEAMTGSWGARLVELGMDELFMASDGQNDPGFISRASSCVEPDADDMAASTAIYARLKSMAQERNLDALSLRCFDLVTGKSATGCYALSRLSDEGVDSGCEGDIPSVLALRWMRLLTGKTGWMANPADFRIVGDSGSLLLAHCTIPLSLTSSYGVRSHFESGLGVAIAGAVREGEVTIVRIGGARLEKVWFAEGLLKAQKPEEGLCRTQARVEIGAKAVSSLLERPLGNHLVLVHGHWGTKIRAYVSMSAALEMAEGT